MTEAELDSIYRQYYLPYCDAQLSSKTSTLTWTLFLHAYFTGVKDGMEKDKRIQEL